MEHQEILMEPLVPHLLLMEPLASQELLMEQPVPQVSQDLPLTLDQEFLDKQPLQHMKENLT